jgi:hypothetical protein
MAKLDFPVATVDGQEFIADTGVIYTYIGTPPNGHWTGVSMPDSGQSLDSRFVQVIGDTMTGQLTLPGGGNNSQALQKQEIDALISNAEDPLLGNYLRTDAAAGAQTVQSTSSTEFKGGIRSKDDVLVELAPGTAKWGLECKGEGIDNSSGLFQTASDNYELNVRASDGRSTRISSNGNMFLNAKSGVIAEPAFIDFAVNSDVKSNIAYIEDRDYLGVNTVGTANLKLGGSGNGTVGIGVDPGAEALVIGGDYTYTAADTFIDNVLIAPKVAGSLSNAFTSLLVAPEPSSDFTAPMVRGITIQARGDIPETVNQYYAIRTPEVTAGTNLTTEVYGHWSGINQPAGSTRYNFYAAGDAPNYFEGLVESKGGVKVSGGSVVIDHVYENDMHYVSMVRANGAQSAHTGFFANKAGAYTTIDTVRGFWASNGLNNGVNNSYGFISSLSDNSGKTFNFYAEGSAPNYFRGDTLVCPASSLALVGINKFRDFRDGFSSGAYIDFRGSLMSSRDPASVAANLFLENHSTTNPNFIEFRINATQVGDMGSDGTNLRIAGLSGGPLILDKGADARQVTSTEAITNASAVVQQLQPAKINGTRHGFTAAALQPLFAEAVTGTPDATEAIGTLSDYDGTILKTAVVEPEAEELTYTEEVETDGVATMVTRNRTWSPTGTQPVYQGVDQTKLIPLLTKALQEALTKIDMLETRLETLENA